MLEYSIIKIFIIHIVELIILLTLLVELIILLFKITKDDRGKAQIVLLMMSTVAIRDLMLQTEGIKEVSNVLVFTDIFIIIIVFILINIKEFLHDYFISNNKDNTKNSE